MPPSNFKPSNQRITLSQLCIDLLDFLREDFLEMDRTPELTLHQGPGPIFHNCNDLILPYLHNVCRAADGVGGGEVNH